VYKQRGPGAGLSEEEIETINKLVADRAEAKNVKDFDTADAIFNELGDTYNVNVDDRAGEWALRHEEYQMSSYTAFVPDPEVQRTIGDLLAQRIMARKNRDFDLADKIRQELEGEYLIKIDDKNKEWRVSQPEGAIWSDEDADEEGMNFVDKEEFESDDDESDDEDFLDEDEDASNESDGVDLSSLTVPELKAKLKEAGLPVSGVKAELIERLSAA
jgi:hypothetical protein